MSSLQQATGAIDGQTAKKFNDNRGQENEQNARATYLTSVMKIYLFSYPFPLFFSFYSSSLCMVQQGKCTKITQYDHVR